MARRLGIFAFFESVPEPRVERTRLHPLVNVLIMAMLAMICVGEGWEDMEEFGLAKAEWLGTLLDLRNGIPSADTFRRVLSAVNPKAFNACFIAWVQALSAGTEGKLVAIDGKTVRHSFNRATGRKALHIVSAWIAENRLTLGQVLTEEKSNEITAIPKLLELLDIRGATITVDAMGCQRAIAEKVIAQGGDYIMGLKGNQETAHKEVEAFFRDACATDVQERAAHVPRDGRRERARTARSAPRMGLAGAYMVRRPRKVERAAQHHHARERANGRQREDLERAPLLLEQSHRGREGIRRHDSRSLGHREPTALVPRRRIS